ncbi:hypothetical protein I0C86_30405 [Plantactinospora sp. S1510]|uniref:Uncharacterized protein n=1 Tax=Plantactinospora alkalitolerans TaxID=2789879 RepID=A0ABS0H458_9ACTN|nr:DUF5954 family protein [Plantactinospora alkalitolerans]MBF9133243.1 hypothetical protein [Plantactinospora alkalitolerans]
MANHGKRVPDHLLIKIEQRNDPVSAVSEDDARIRSVAYPTLLWSAPVFGAAEEVDGRWRIIQLNADEPQHARDGLASHFRRLFSETPQTVEHAAERAEYEAVYELLDWEAVDELTANDRRYRIIRAQPFIRMGADGPEPPRPTDPDPYPPGQADRSTSQLDGFVIDPTASTGLTDGLVRMEMISTSYRTRTVPEDVHADSRRVLTTHPNVVLLPVGYTIGEYVAGSWRPRSFATYPTPQAARDAGSFSIRDIALDENTPIEEFTAAYQRARAAHRPPRTDDFDVQGVPCRVTRIETFVRVGPDGPEGPRPSDRDSQPPPARHVHQLRAQGLMPDPD